MTRHRELLESDELNAVFPIFRDAERVIADVPVRNRGTLGGALCQADPSEDLSQRLHDARRALRDPEQPGRADRCRWTTSTAARTRPRSARPRC